jgi:hypothetical protein
LGRAVHMVAGGPAERRVFVRLCLACPTPVRHIDHPVAASGDSRWQGCPTCVCSGSPRQPAGLRTKAHFQSKSCICKSGVCAAHLAAGAPCRFMPCDGCCGMFLAHACPCQMLLLPSLGMHLMMQPGSLALLLRCKHDVLLTSRHRYRHVLLVGYPPARCL